MAIVIKELIIKGEVSKFNNLHTNTEVQQEDLKRLRKEIIDTLEKRWNKKIGKLFDR